MIETEKADERDVTPEVWRLQCEEGGVHGDADDAEVEVVEEERGVVVNAHTRVELELQLPLNDALHLVVICAPEKVSSKFILRLINAD